MTKSVWKSAIAAILLCVLAGCGSKDGRPGTASVADRTQQKEDGESSVMDKDNRKEVVFLNYVPNGLETDDVVGVRSAYGEHEGKETTLYAYAVHIIHLSEPESEPSALSCDFPEREPGESEKAWRMRSEIFLAKKAVDIMERKGISVLYDYPLCTYGKRDLDMEAYYSPENWGYEACVVIGTQKEIAEVFGDYGLTVGHYLLRAKSAPRPDAMDVLKKRGWDFQSDYTEQNPEDYAPYFGSERYVTQSVFE